MKNKLILLLSLFLICLFFFGCKTKKKSILSDQELITKWKIEKTTIKEIEFNTNFGWFVDLNNERWQKFKSNFKKGDEIWIYQSPPITWEKLMGTQGYAIFRKGKLILLYETLRN